MLSWTLQSLGPLIALVAMCAALYALPGYAVLAWLWPASARGLSAAERFAAALGIGFALPPILLYATRLLGLTWSPVATWLYLIVALIALAVPLVLRPARGQRPAWQPHKLLRWDVCLVLGLTLLALLVRLYTVRDLRAGLFGDSYHHTLIVQLMLDNGGLFDTYLPYAPLTSFTYHFGFHANVAFYAWLTGMPATLSTLIIGQVMNAAAVPLAFLLTSRIVGSPTSEARVPVAVIAGVWAAALTGFVNLMPAYYVNWGRFTQLAGQLILPAAVVCWVELLERATHHPLRAQGRLLALCAVLTVSLMLTHYIVTIFAAVMVGSYLLALIIRRASWRATGQMLAPAVLGAAVALVIALPWIRATLGGGLVRNTTLMVNGAAGAAAIAAYAALVPITPAYLKTWMLMLAAGGVLIALAQRQWRPAMFAVWTALLIVIVTPQTFGLPGAGVVEQFAVYIALYITVLPLCGYALAAIQVWLASRLALFWSGAARPAVQIGLTAVAVCAIAVWGSGWSRSIANPSQQMLTPADERAMQWIRDNTPAEARFLINSLPAYRGTLIAGTDGGMWIPLLAGRQTNVPPMLYGSERWASDDFYLSTSALPEALRGRPLTDATPVSINPTTPENVQRLRDAGIRFVYSGANQTPGPDQADQLDTRALRSSSDFQLVYARDGVEIFKLVE